MSKFPRFHRRPLAARAQRQADGTWIVIREGEPQEIYTDKRFRQEYKASETAAELELKKEVKVVKVEDATVTPNPAKHKTKKRSETVTVSEDIITETKGGEVTYDTNSNDPEPTDPESGS